MRKLAVCVDFMNEKYRRQIDAAADAAGFVVHYYDTQAALTPHIGDYEVLFGHPVPALLRQASQLKWLCSDHAGVDRYLDDAAYCRSWIHDRVQFHPCGRQKMAFELEKKISDRQLVQQSLEEYFPEEQELELAMAAAMKKIESSRSAVSREQIGRFLYTRGYGGSLVNRVLHDETIHEMIENSRQGQCNNNF